VDSSTNLEGSFEVSGDEGKSYKSLHMSPVSIVRESENESETGPGGDSEGMI